jgi:hypothetical protein
MALSISPISNTSPACQLVLDKTLPQTKPTPTQHPCSLKILKHVMPSRTKLKIAKLKSFDRLQNMLGLV